MDFFILLLIIVHNRRWVYFELKSTITSRFPRIRLSIFFLRSVYFKNPYFLSARQLKVSVVSNQIVIFRDHSIA
jgi:hypothetical protein